GEPGAGLLPSLLAASDALGTGWFGADAAQAAPGRTVAVVGDGAVGLCAVLAARQLGAERVVVSSRHPDRQALARGLGATDVLAERGDAYVARVKELTGGVRRPRRRRGRRYRGVGVAGDRGRAARWARRLGRRAARGHARRPTALHDRRAPPRGPRTRAAVPARAGRPRLAARDRPGQGLRPHAPARE